MDLRAQSFTRPFLSRYKKADSNLNFIDKNGSRKFKYLVLCHDRRTLFCELALHRHNQNPGVSGRQYFCGFSIYSSQLVDHSISLFINDKHDNINLNITNFPFLRSNVPYLFHVFCGIQGLAPLVNVLFRRPREFQISVSHGYVLLVFCWDQNLSRFPDFYF